MDNLLHSCAGLCCHMCGSVFRVDGDDGVAARNIVGWIFKPAVVKVYEILKVFLSEMFLARSVTLGDSVHACLREGFDIDMLVCDIRGDASHGTIPCVQKRFASRF